MWEKLIEWMDEKGVTGELHDPKYQDEAFRMSEYRQGTVVRDAIARLIAASNGEECFHRAQSYGISWGLVHAAEENYDIPHYQQRNYWRSIEHPEIGRAIPYPRGPVACDALADRARGPCAAPRRAHAAGPPAGSGPERDEIDALAAAGAIR